MDGMRQSYASAVLARFRHSSILLIVAHAPAKSALIPVGPGPIVPRAESPASLPRLGFHRTCESVASGERFRTAFLLPFIGPGVPAPRLIVRPIVRGSREKSLALNLPGVRNETIARVRGEDEADDQVRRFSGDGADQPDRFQMFRNCCWQAGEKDREKARVMRRSFTRPRTTPRLI